MDGPSAAAAIPTSESTLFARGRRAATAGALAMISLLAFEAMAVATAMPAIAAALDGMDRYALAFGALTAASMLGLLLAGRWCDRRGPLPVTRLGLAVFTAGLLLAGASGSMTLLLLGRLVQGLGSGLLGVALYVGMGRLVPPALHPRLFAGFAAAWVLPALIGPPAAALVVEHLGWRSVFLAVAALMPLVAWLLLPAFGRLPPPAAPAPHAGGSALDLARRVLVAAPGLPAVLALRGLLAAAFAAAEAFIPLYLHREAGWSLARSGAVLTAGALLWSVGSAWQARLQDEVLRRRGLAVGFGLLSAGLAVVMLPMLGLLPAIALVPGWALAGLGIGVAFPMLSVLTLRLSAPAEQGRSASALQLCDALCSSLALAGAGALFNAAGGAGEPGGSAHAAALGLALAIASSGLLLVRWRLGGV